MENRIEIPTGNPNIVIAIMEDYNARYKVNLRLITIEDRDGVEFVIIDKNDCNLTDVYMFGFFHGMEIQELRQKGKIDW